MKKVLIICPYSFPSECGIWRRVYNDARTLIQDGYDVTVFSSNIKKGTDEILPDYDEHEGIKIYRFPVRLKLGGTSMFFFFPRKFREIDPDYVHVHGFRHPHSIQGLLLSKLLSKKTNYKNQKNKTLTPSLSQGEREQSLQSRRNILTVHGTFGKDPRRSWHLKLIDVLYDLLISWWEIRLYDKVVYISRWEIPHLKRRGASEKQLVYLPNSIDEIFLSGNNGPHPDPLLLGEGEGVGPKPPTSTDSVQATQGEGIASSPNYRVFYMGRLDPIKRLEWFVDFAKALPSVNFLLYGPNNGYDSEFLNLQLDNLKIINEAYSPDKFIEISQNSDIFLLPSIRESFGIVALEAMSQGNIVISTDTRGPTELIQDHVNGFLVHDKEEMLERIQYVYNNWDGIQEVRQNAISTASQFSAEKIGIELLKMYIGMVS